MRVSWMALSLVVIVGVSGCDRQDAVESEALPPLVRTIKVMPAKGATLGLSGVVRAAVEVPLSFQVDGRIAARHVDAGAVVTAGQTLLALDKRDLQQAVSVAVAEQAAAHTAMTSAEADLQRYRELVSKRFVSQQELERAEQTFREARSRMDTATANLRQVQNALGYGELKAPDDGVLMDVMGEPGQVVAAGQSMAILAKAGGRDVEVYFPDGVVPPATGLLATSTGQIDLQLREKAGAVEVQGRTLRARYAIAGNTDDLVLGSVVEARFGEGGTAGDVLAVPLGALNERGAGPSVWRFHDGIVSTVPVTLLAMDAETAQIRGPLQAGDVVVALGAHLLSEGMPVRELQQ